MNKIIAFGYVNLSDHWASLFYFDQLHNAGFHITYLNIDPVTLSQNAKIENYSSYIEQVTVNSILEFRHIVQENKGNTIFIPCVTIVPEVWELFSVLLQEKAKTCYIHVGELFQPERNYDSAALARKVRKLFSRIPFDRLNYALRRRKFVSRLQVAFVAGSVAENFHRSNGCNNIVPINVRDFEDVLEVQDDKERVLQEDYCLFLDGFLPYHPDNKADSIYIEPEAYFQSLNCFFDYVEETLEVNVIIAAHPKSRYDEVGNKFNGRKIIKGNTIRLMKDARLILNHDSSVACYSTIFKVPMLFLTTNGIDQNKGNYGGTIRTYADLMGCRMVNTDIKESFEKYDLLHLCIDERKYKNYMYSYLTSPESEGKKSCDTLIAEFKTL